MIDFEEAAAGDALDVSSIGVELDLAFRPQINTAIVAGPVGRPALEAVVAVDAEVVHFGVLATDRKIAARYRRNSRNSRNPILYATCLTTRNATLYAAFHATLNPRHGWPGTHLECFLGFRFVFIIGARVAYPSRSMLVRT